VASVFRSYSSDIGRYVPLDRSVEEVTNEVEASAPSLVSVYI
jgi:hypothetical protein